MLVESRCFLGDRGVRVGGFDGVAIWSVGVSRTVLV